jgi:gamma-glutamyl-gamma-aminobutyrate hydrolase PuuD
MKIYIVGNGFDGYINWIKDVVKVDTPEEADLLLFGGGADVDPSLYGEKTGKYTYTDLNRDKRELAIFNTFINKPKLGICRGLQFLTVASSGSIIQHVTRHAGYVHAIEDSSSATTFLIPSTHHQMVWPFDVEHKMIATAFPKRSSTYLDGSNNEIELPDYFVESEIVFYPKTKSLGIQGHPEMSYSETLHEYLNGLITKYLLDG